MPTIEIKWFDGRSKEQKAKVAKAITKLRNKILDPKEKIELSKKAENYAKTEFGYQKTIDLWHESMLEVISEYKNRKAWTKETL